MADSSNGIIRGPWWAELLKTLGPTAAIAIGLTFWLTQDLSPVLQAMNNFMVYHGEQMGQLIKDEQDDARQRAEQWAQIGRMQATQHIDHEAALNLEEKTCLNTAKTGAYQTCIDIRNAGEKELQAEIPEKP